MVRKPCGSGMFYESEACALNQQIKNCFLDKFGPGLEKNILKPKGIIVPHAGYSYSGSCAAWAYNTISSVSTVIVMGPSHHGNKTCLSDEAWETPLGIIDPAADLIEVMKKGCGLEVDNSAHYSEHSIEVQLPLLQYILEEKFLVVCLMVSGDFPFDELSKKLQAVIPDDTLIVCSSDFTHYGKNYGYVPFEDNIKSNLERLDMGAVRCICEADYLGFKSYLKNTGATVCGAQPIELLLRVLGKRGTLLKYYSSGDISGDYRTSVGYASIVF